MKTHNPEYHKSVLMDEVVEYLALKPGGVYVDATFGGGGHTRAMLLAEPTCRVIACDWDQRALDYNGPALQEEFPGRIEFLWGNFAQLPRLFKKYDIAPVDGILADFGTSQYQIMEREGFSFSADTPLDMRMSPAHFRVTAADIVNKASENELMTIFQDYGEERFSRTIARAICAARVLGPIKTTGDLVRVITSVVSRKKGMIHPATRVFQALRIVVNHELENIETFLKHTLLSEVLRPEGRVVCISFHSLEDRIVKRFFKQHETCFRLLTPKVVVPGEREVRENPSSRSSKLRAAQKLCN